MSENKPIWLHFLFTASSVSMTKQTFSVELSNFASSKNAYKYSNRIYDCVSLQIHP